METLKKLISDCEYKLKSGNANYKNTMECDYLLRTLKQIEKEVNKLINTPK